MSEGEESIAQLVLAPKIGGTYLREQIGDPCFDELHRASD